MTGPKPNSRASRYAVLDSLRGLGSTQVVVFHWSLTTGSSLMQHWPLYNSWISLDFFFVLSGFVIAYVYGDKLRDLRSTMGFAVRRFGRIWPLHIAVLAALVLFIGTINIALPHQSWMAITPTTPPFGYMSLITEVLLLNSVGIWDNFYWNVPSWSMGAEFNVYVLFALVCLISRQALAIAAAVMTVVAIVALALWSPKYLSADVNMGIFRCMAGFFAGVVAYRAHAFAMRRWPSLADLRKSLAGTAVEILVLAVITVFAYNLDAFGTFSLLSLASPILFGVMVFVFSFASGGVSNLIDRPIFHRLGDLSYSIYVVHWPLLIVVWYVMFLLGEYANFDLRWYFLNSRLLSGLGLILFTPIVWFVSSYTYRLIEVPWRDKFATIGRRIERGDAQRAQTRTVG